jgi:predicted transcriptional regulator
MADGGLTLKIDEELAERLKVAAEAAGESVDDYARHALEAFAEAPADWEEIDRIAEETVAKGDGIPWEEVKAWMQSWDGKTRVPFRRK